LLAIAVLAGEGGGVIRPDGQFPELESLSGNGRFGLREGDGVNQPVGTAVFRDVSRAVGIKDRAGEGMAVLALGTGELLEFCGVEGSAIGHGLGSFLNVTPTAGAKEAKAEANRAAIHPPTRESA